MKTQRKTTARAPSARKGAAKGKAKAAPKKKAAPKRANMQRKFAQATRRNTKSEISRIRKNPKTSHLGEVGLPAHPMFPYVDKWLNGPHIEGVDTFQQMIGMLSHYVEDHMKTTQQLLKAFNLCNALATDIYARTIERATQKKEENKDADPSVCADPVPEASETVTETVAEEPKTDL